MPSNISQVLGLPYMQPSQAQKHVTHNEALKRLDIMVQLVVSSRSTSTPPSDPPEGRRHIVPAGASGDWAGQDGKLTVFQSGAWIFIDPLVGWQAYVKDENRHVTYENSDWHISTIPSELQNMNAVGINTSADATNPLAASGDATLLTHDGDDHRLKINKAASADTASLLFQDGFSGRAEMGLAGSDDFNLRVSPDGSTWTSALTVDAATGTPTAPEGLEVQGALTGSAIVGTVSESGGVSTGAIIEEGSNANGAYTKFANGLMIMTSAGLSVPNVTNAAGSLYMSDQVIWTFPATPVGPVHMSGSGNGSRLWTMIGTATATDCAIRLVSFVNSFTTTRPVSATAICRWF